MTFTVDQPGGEAAQRFYAALGFAPAEVIAWGPDALPRQVYRRQIPTREAGMLAAIDRMYT